MRGCSLCKLKELQKTAREEEVTLEVKSDPLGLIFPLGKAVYVTNKNGRVTKIAWFSSIPESCDCWERKD